MRDERLIQALKDRHLLREDQVQVVLEEQERTEENVASLVVRWGFVESDEMVALLSDVTGLPLLRLKEAPPDPTCVHLFGYDVMRRYQFCAWERQGSVIKVAIVDPVNVMTRDRVREYLRTRLGLGTSCVFALISQEDFEQLLQTFDAEETSTARALNGDNSGEDVVAYLDALLKMAVEMSASDIHFQPSTHVVHVRFRIDGRLQTVRELHKRVWSHMVIRLKILSNLDIAESRRPQSGHFEDTLRGRKVDFRISTHPTIQGESLVVRILVRQKELLALEQLGFEEETIKRLKRLIRRPYGLFVLCGPTGSGKTTTLYSLCARMDALTKNIMTLEDPVEYVFDQIRQTEIQPGVINFADGVRSLLRQDPDVLLLGEIRDEETAQMALRASMTGHLVLATLHANDVLSAPYRLQDLGLPLSRQAGQILAILSQRLVRRYCIHCHGGGCPSCHQTGFKGRLAISEMLENDEKIDACLAQALPWNEWKQCATTRGYVSLYEDGLLKVRKGLTSLTEVNQVCGRDDDNSPIC